MITTTPSHAPRCVHRRRGARLAALLAVATLAAACSSGGTTATPASTAPGSSTPTGSTPGAAAVGRPVNRPTTPTGPVPAVHPITGGAGRPNAPAPAKLLADSGYVEEEYEFSGDATAYRATGTWTEDGMWSAEPAGTAPYASRVLVRRPTDPATFNGTVLVEWMNVTAGADVAVDFGYTNEELLDEGAIYVGVTAQAVGHAAVKNFDPARYEALVHPGDQYSYDLFTQAGRAVLANRFFPTTYGVQRIIADGESQSAGRMTTYINALQQQADVYDAFLVHSRSDRTTPLGPDQPAPTGARIRTDLRSPTLVVLTETDVLGNLKSQQPDSPTFRRWEIAGSAHVDNYDLSVLSGTDPTQPAGLGAICEKPINMAHQWWVMNAGLRSLAGWIGGGPPPPEGPRMTIGADNQYVLDAHGNATGGIRLADQDVPTATNSGLGNNPSFCRLYGVTTAFDAATLQQLYPSRADYVAKRNAAIDGMRAKGFIVERDATAAKQAP